VPKLVWRVKLVAELEPGVATETEVARIERGEEAGPAELGLRLEEAKRLTATLQAEIVTAQVATVGERRRWCAACGQPLAGKGHYRRPSARCSARCRSGSAAAGLPLPGPGEPKSFAALELGGGAVAPELAYVTARYAALAPFGKVAALLAELLPLGGAANAGTVRNRTRRVGEDVVQPHAAEAAKRPVARAAGPVVVGFDGGHVRSRRPEEERHFEVIAGKVIDARGVQHRFAFARRGQPASAEALRQALAAAGVDAATPATVLADGDAGLWHLQREVLPGATPVLDWWHAAVRFEHASQTARGLEAPLARRAERDLERAKWRLWHGRRAGCRDRLAALLRWTGAGRCARRPGSTASGGTSPACWATSSATRERWCPTPPGVGAGSRSRPPSWRAR
jgi:hypothetical protein